MTSGIVPHACLSIVMILYHLYVVINVTLLVVVHVSQPESTASCTVARVLPDWVVAYQCWLRWSESFLVHNRKLARDLISCYQIRRSI